MSMYSDIYDNPNRLQVNRRICNMPLRYHASDCDIEMVWLVIHAPRTMEEKDNATPVFHHHTFFETHFVLQGQQAYQLSDGRELVAGEGEVIMLPPMSSHRGLWKSEDMCKVAFAFSIERSDPTVRSELLNCFSMEAAVYTVSDILPSLIALLMKEVVQQQKFCQEMLSSLLYQMVLAYARLSPAMSDKREETMQDRAVDGRVGEITRYIEEHMTEAIQVNDIAEHIHISPKQINRILQREMQIKCSDYIDRKKAEQAKQLLSYTDMRIPDIATAIGFANAFSFSKFFKRMEGMPPGLFRQSRYNHFA